MSKLTTKDIEALGEGPQIRKYIETRYASVADFHNSNELPVSLKTLRTYLSQDEIQSDPLKQALVQIFNVDYNEIVKSKSEQVKKNVWDIFEDIKSYKNKEDFELFVKVHELCRQYDLRVEVAMMCRAEAMNCFYRNYTDWAIELFEKAIKLMENLKIDLYVFFIIELANLYYKEGMLPNAEKEYNRAEELIGNYIISDGTLFKYYYWRGIMLNNTNEHSKAREFFNDAYKYTEDTKEKAAAMMNIGLSYKKELDYEKALEQYFKTLEYYDDRELIGRGVIYNNIAVVYLEQGNLKAALENSVKAIALISLTDDLRREFIFKQTYIHIKLLMGDVSAYKNFLDILKNTINKQIDKKFVIEGICSIIDLLADKEVLNKLIFAVIELIKHTTNRSYENDLYMCIGKLQVKVIKLSEGGI